jgi:hypothetical protein
MTHLPLSSANPTAAHDLAEAIWDAAGATELEIVQHMLRALARVRALADDELLEEWRRIGGQLELDSKEAEAVISKLEIECGYELARIEDLRRDQLSTLGNLSRLIRHRLRAVNPASGGGEQ